MAGSPEREEESGAGGDQQAEEEPGTWEPEITFHGVGLGLGGPSLVSVPLRQDGTPPWPSLTQEG